MLPTIEKTIVYLSDEEAKRFVAFQRHYALIGMLESLGAFSIQPGSVTIHFNKLGQIQSVEKKEYFTP